MVVTHAIRIISRLECASQHLEYKGIRIIGLLSPESDQITSVIKTGGSGCFTSNFIFSQKNGCQLWGGSVIHNCEYFFRSVLKRHEKLIHNNLKSDFKLTLTKLIIGAAENPRSGL